MTFTEAWLELIQAKDQPNAEITEFGDVEALKSYLLNCSPANRLLIFINHDGYYQLRTVERDFYDPVPQEKLKHYGNCGSYLGYPVFSDINPNNRYSDDADAANVTVIRKPFITLFYPCDE